MRVPHLMVYYACSQEFISPRGTCAALLLRALIVLGVSNPSHFSFLWDPRDVKVLLFYGTDVGHIIRTHSAARGPNVRALEVSLCKSDTAIE